MTDERLAFIWLRSVPLDLFAIAHESNDAPITIAFNTAQIPQVANYIESKWQRPTGWQHEHSLLYNTHSKLPSISCYYIVPFHENPDALASELVDLFPSQSAFQWRRVSFNGTLRNIDLNQNEAHRQWVFLASSYGPNLHTSRKKPRF